MLPTTNDLIPDYESQEQASLTYKLNTDKETIKGNIDKLEAVKQAIYLILNIERYDYIIYSWNYGFETKDLIGEEYSYVCSELKRRIEEALVQDDRINSVDSFSFEKNKGKVHVTFIAHTIYGDVNDGTEVSI